MRPHLFTVDVEEHFQVSAFDGVVSRDEWAAQPSRVDQNVAALLEQLARHGARGTFFVLAWLADKRPHVVREIAAAGHEIASHGFWHRRVNTQSVADFRDDLRASKAMLEDCIGVAVNGYRAPSFSIIRGCEWAFDVLIEEGFTYDSSVFPIRRHGYGYAGAPREPYRMTRSSGSLMEFPLATTTIGGVALPAAGGGYLRHFPLRVIERAFAEAEARSTSATFYIHPWEIDPDQPRLPVGFVTTRRHYHGLARTRERIEALLTRFQFTSIAAWLQHAPTLATAGGAA